MKRKPANAGKPWTADDLSRMKALADGGAATGAIARILERTPASIALKASDERISLKQPPRSPPAQPH